MRTYPFLLPGTVLYRRLCRKNDATDDNLGEGLSNSLIDPQWRELSKFPPRAVEIFWKVRNIIRPPGSSKSLDRKFTARLQIGRLLAHTFSDLF